MKFNFKFLPPTSEMIEAAKELRTGQILVVYEHDGRILMETEYGRNLYEWLAHADPPNTGEFITLRF